MASASGSSTLGPVPLVLPSHTNERSERLYASDPEHAGRYTGQRIHAVDGRLSMRRLQRLGIHDLYNPEACGFWTSGFTDLAA